MQNYNEAMLREQMLRSRIEKFIDNSKKTAIAKRTKAFYEIKLEELKQLWIEYKQIDHDLNSTFVHEAKEDATVPDDTYVIIESKYSEYLSELLEGIRKFSTTDTQPSQQPILIHDTILPKIELPKFDGSYDAWYSFHDLFVSLIHNNGQLNPVQKLHHLKSCLVGEAAGLLRHVPVTNENYNSAWVKVKQRYENKRILINHHLRTLLNQQKLTTENATGLKGFISTTDDCLQQITNLQIDIRSWDILLIHILIQKLPFITLKMWEEEQGASQDLPTYKQFHKFLCKRHKILESLSDIVSTKQIHQTTNLKPNTRVHHAIKENMCSACNNRHFLQRCAKYLSMSPSSRRKLVTTAGHCYNCLSKDHITRHCNSKFRCLRCKEKHHTTLHEDKQSGFSNINPPHQQPTHTATGISSIPHLPNSSANDMHATPHQPNKQQAHSATESNNTHTFMTRKVSHTLLSTALVLTRGSNGKLHTIRCLLDTGSESSFITQTICRKLGVTCSPVAISISGLNTSPTGKATKQAKLTIESRTLNKVQLTETFLVVNKITDVLPTTEVSASNYQHLNGLELADPEFWKPATIDALLGADVYARIVQNGIRRGSEFSPVAVNTSLGWIVFGTTSDTLDTISKNFTIQITNEDLSNQLQQFWEEEELPARSSFTEDEQHCAEHYSKTYKRLRNGQYQVQLPFKQNIEPKLGDSRTLALKRFHCLERRLQANEGYKKEGRKPQ